MTEKIYAHPKSLNDVSFTYCPGCSHGIIHRIIAELIDEFDLEDKMILIAPVGCTGGIGNYFNVDWFKGSHGRAPAVATGVRRVCPDKFILTYQGDGDLAAIGTAEIIHAAGRGEKITAIFVNNGIYGMTGGQMAPTTLLGQVTTTSPLGRNKNNDGGPIRMTEMLAHLDGVVYLERVAVNNSANIVKAKAAIKKAFELQLQGFGFSLVEVMAICPTNWGLSPIASNKRLEQDSLDYYPLGVIKAPKGGVQA